MRLSVQGGEAAAPLLEGEALAADAAQDASARTEVGSPRRPPHPGDASALLRSPHTTRRPRTRCVERVERMPHRWTMHCG